MPQILEPGTILELEELAAPDEYASFFTNLIKTVTVEYTITGFVSGTIRLRLDGRVGKGGWANLDPSGATILETSNKTDVITVSVAMEEMRLYFVAETGGTDSVINSKVTGLWK